MASSRPSSLNRVSHSSHKGNIETWEHRRPSHTNKFSTLCTLQPFAHLLTTLCTFARASHICTSMFRSLFAERTLLCTFCFTSTSRRSILRPKVRMISSLNSLLPAHYRISDVFPHFAKDISAHLPNDLSLAFAFAFAFSFGIDLTFHCRLYIASRYQHDFLQDLSHPCRFGRPGACRRVQDDDRLSRSARHG